MSVNIIKDLYRCTIIPASEASDGETPTQILVTQETNGYAVWLTEPGDDILIAFYFHYHRDKAIEHAVTVATRRDRYPLMDLRDCGLTIS